MACSAHSNAFRLARQISPRPPCTAQQPYELIAQPGGVTLLLTDARRFLRVASMKSIRLSAHLVGVAGALFQRRRHSAAVIAAGASLDERLLFAAPLARRRHRGCAAVPVRRDVLCRAIPIVVCQSHAAPDLGLWIQLHECSGIVESNSDREDMSTSQQHGVSPVVVVAIMVGQVDVANLLSSFALQ